MLGRTDSGRRLLFMALVFVLLGSSLVVRLGYWQIAQHDRLVDSARRQIYLRVTVPARRGEIYDRSGTIVLAGSVSRDRLVVSAQRMTQPDRERLADLLGSTLELAPADTATILAKLETGRPYLVLAQDLDPARSEAIRVAAAEAGISGLTFESGFARTYASGGAPDQTLAAQLLGFVNREGVGQYGVERYYQNQLAGTPQVMEADKDANGQPLVETERVVEPGVPGADLRLTIDASLQLAVEQEVMAAQIADGAKTVSAVVMDPWTGEIYAQASYPSYDANHYEAVADTDPGRFIDPVISQVYEPGSVFKMLTVLSGLETGTTTLRTKYKDTGTLRLDDGRARIADSDGKAMGTLRLEDAIAYSRNVVAARVALHLGPTLRDSSTTLHAVWRRLGFGDPTGIDLSGEVSGLVNDPAISAWREIDLANGSFGQGVAVTQIQLATAFAAMVNGGTLVKPHVVAAIDGRPIDAASRGQVIDPSLCPQLIGLMNHVTENPWYSKDANLPGYWLGGKSGTAQIWDAVHRRWFSDRLNFSFVGFIGRQAGHPDLVVAVKIGNGRPAITGPGQLVLALKSTELFRRIASDAITTPGLLPDVPVEDAPIARLGG
jgi:cell division protein FtsI (penicillin-binding protein 3)